MKTTDFTTFKTEIEIPYTEKTIWDVPEIWAKALTEYFDSICGLLADGYEFDTNKSGCYEATDHTYIRHYATLTDADGKRIDIEANLSHCAECTRITNFKTEYTEHKTDK